MVPLSAVCNSVILYPRPPLASSRPTNASQTSGSIGCGGRARFHYLHSLLGIKGEADFGARYMFEQSDRKQLRNLLSGTGAFSSCVGTIGTTNTCLGENNLRTTNAYAFLLKSGCSLAHLR